MPICQQLLVTSAHVEPPFADRSIVRWVVSPDVVTPSRMREYLSDPSVYPSNVPDTAGVPGADGAPEAAAFTTTSSVCVVESTCLMIESTV